MKRFSRIFGILTILMSLAMGALAILRCQVEKENLVKEAATARASIAQNKLQAAQFKGEIKLIADADISEAQRQLDRAPSASTYLAMQIFFFVLSLFSLMFGVFLFRPTEFTLPSTGIAFFVALLLYLIVPDAETGERGGLSIRTMVLLVAVPVMVSGLCASLASRKGARNS